MTIEPITVSKDLHDALDRVNHAIIYTATIDSIAYDFVTELQYIKITGVIGYRNMLMYMLATNCYKLQEYQYYCILAINEKSNGGLVFDYINQFGYIQTTTDWKSITIHTATNNTLETTDIPKQFYQFIVKRSGNLNIIIKDFDNIKNKY